MNVEITAYIVDEKLCKEAKSKLLYKFFVGFLFVKILSVTLKNSDERMVPVYFPAIIKTALSNILLGQLTK